MSTFAKIKCKKCNNSFDIYWNDMPNSPYKCPHCFAQIDEHMSEQLKNAIGTVWDLNYHFKKYANERNEPDFSVDIINVEIPADKG